VVRDVSCRDAFDVVTNQQTSKLASARATMPSSRWSAAVAPRQASLSTRNATTDVYVSHTDAFTLSSPTLVNGRAMPAEYTCEAGKGGKLLVPPPPFPLVVRDVCSQHVIASTGNYSPALKWRNVPARTESFVLMLRDVTVRDVDSQLSQRFERQNAC
jgi:hypothetical protein